MQEVDLSRSRSASSTVCLDRKHSRCRSHQGIGPQSFVTKICHFARQRCKPRNAKKRSSLTSLPRRAGMCRGDVKEGKEAEGHSAKRR